LLTVDLVRVIRRNGRLHVPRLNPAKKKLLLRYAEEYITLAGENVGRTQGEFRSALSEPLRRATSDFKMIKGVRKLVEDRCTFEARTDVEPRALRKALFTAATEARKTLEDSAIFDAAAVIEEVAAVRGIPPGEVDGLLYADLKENHKCTKFDTISAPALVDLYVRSQKQAVLLRAVKVVVKIRCADPAGYRMFFQKLKFRRLLHTIDYDKQEDRYRIEIDGPFSLFKAVTRYGLQLALMLPALEESGGRWELDADIKWGRERKPFVFHLEGKPESVLQDCKVRLPDEVEQLLERFKGIESPWKARVANDLLDLPGVGLCVPDLVFTHEESGIRIFLEVLGYWSREAVWRRVELVEAGLPFQIIFAVSRRLRVSEEVLDKDLPGRLYVYQRVMSATSIIKRLREILKRQRTVETAELKKTGTRRPGR